MRKYLEGVNSVLCEKSSWNGGCAGLNSTHLTPIHVQPEYQQMTLFGKGFPSVTVVKNPPANAGDSRDSGLIPESGRFPWRRK